MWWLYDKLCLSHRGPLPEATLTESNRRIPPDLVGFGWILIFGKFGIWLDCRIWLNSVEFGWTLSDFVKFCWNQSDSVGIGPTLSDLVRIRWNRSDLVGFWSLVNLVGFGLTQSDLVGFWSLVNLDGFGLTRSHLVGFWSLVNLVGFGLTRSDSVGFCRIRSEMWKCS